MDITFIKKDESKRMTLGVVYSPDDVDSQEDYSSADEIEKACHEFMKYLQGQTAVNKRAAELLSSIVKALDSDEPVQVDVTDVYDDIIQKGALGYNHEEWPDDIGDIVESYIAPVDFAVDGEVVKAGTWLMAVKWTPVYWEKVQRGEINGYSMGGSGVRVPE